MAGLIVFVFTVIALFYLLGFVGHHCSIDCQWYQVTSGVFTEGRHIWVGTCCLITPFMHSLVFPVPGASAHPYRSPLSWQVCQPESGGLKCRNNMHGPFEPTTTWVYVKYVPKHPDCGPHDETVLKGAARCQCDGRSGKCDMNCLMGVWERLSSPQCRGCVKARKVFPSASAGCCAVPGLIRFAETFCRLSSVGHSRPVFVETDVFRVVSCRGDNLQQWCQSRHLHATTWGTLQLGGNFLHTLAQNGCL